MCNASVLSLFRNLLEQYTDHNATYGYYWYPLSVLKKDVPVVAYDLRKLYQDNGMEQVEAVLNRCNIRVVQAFQMLNDNTETHAEDMIELLYKKDDDGYILPWEVETYYFDDSKEWMIYVSHEWTVTFTGDSLVRAAKETIQAKYLYC